MASRQPVDKGKEVGKFFSGFTDIFKEIGSWFGATGNRSKKVGSGALNHGARGLGRFGEFSHDHPAGAALVVILAAAAPVTWIYKKFKKKQELKVEQKRMQNLEDASYIDALRHEKASLTLAPTTYADQAIAADIAARRQLAAINSEQEAAKYKMQTQGHGDRVLAAKSGGVGMPPSYNN